MRPSDLGKKSKTLSPQFFIIFLHGSHLSGSAAPGSTNKSRALGGMQTYLVLLQALQFTISNLQVSKDGLEEFGRQR